MSIRRKQDLCLDAIEYSLSMAHIAYERVANYCLRLSDIDDTRHDTTLVLDAWSFIDVAKRLRSLLQNTPGIKNTEILTEFLIDTEKVTDFRHHVQHIEEKTATVAPSGLPIWGSFSWVTFEPNGKVFKSCVYMPGRIAKASGIPALTPSREKLHHSVQFAMTIGAVTIDISEVASKIEKFHSHFDAALKVAAEKQVNSEIIRVIDLRIVNH